MAAPVPMSIWIQPMADDPSAQPLFEAFGSRYAATYVDANERYRREHPPPMPKHAPWPMSYLAIFLVGLFGSLFAGQVYRDRKLEICPLPMGNPNEVSPCAIAGTVAGLAFGFRADMNAALRLRWYPPCILRVSSRLSRIYVKSLPQCALPALSGMQQCIRSVFSISLQVTGSSLISKACRKDYTTSS